MIEGRVESFDSAQGPRPDLGSIGRFRGWKSPGDEAEGDEKQKCFHEIGLGTGSRVLRCRGCRKGKVGDGATRDG